MRPRLDRHRRGTTLPELLVALTLGAVVLGTASASLLRQQGTARRVTGIVAGAAQGRAAAMLLPAELADLDPSAGDLAAGEARDSALQLRASIATGVACDSAVGQVLLALSDGDDLAPGGLASPPRAGDSLWWYAEATSGWRAQRIADVRAAVARCPVRVGGDGEGPVLRIILANRDTVPVGAMLRLTRPIAYVVYRSGDGSWQLGMREWSDAVRGFAPPQPIAGPFARRLGTGVRTGFRYFDAGGSELPPGGEGADISRIARVRITTVALVRSAVAGADSVHVDSADVALQRTGGP
ncbi:MAG: hypothetical protein ACJ8AD_10465 [Gemmatimonadaceae bacterium]